MIHSIRCLEVENRIYSNPEKNAKNSVPQSVNYYVTDFRRTLVRFKICSLRFTFCSIVFFSLFSGFSISWALKERKSEPKI